MAALSYEQVRQLVDQNNNSTFTTDLLVCLIWKESSFDTEASPGGGGSALGLMQMTNAAIQTVNNSTPSGVHFEHADMTDPAKAIQCGTYYLSYLLHQAAGDPTTALNNYHGQSGYADNILQCELCLASNPTNPQSCLSAIHAFSRERHCNGGHR